MSVRTYGDDKQFLEPSLQAKDLGVGKQCRDALLADLAGRGLEPDPDRKPKTEMVLMDLLLAPNHA